MNVLVAPDKFKGCLSAGEAARLMARGARRFSPRASVRLLPLADGGDGTAEVLRKALKGRRRSRIVLGPRGGEVRASWTWIPRGRAALIELAQASGWAHLLPRDRKPLLTTTYGTGQLIRAALAAGAREVLVALGGSATVDGGLGVLQALGAGVFLKGGRFLDEAAAGRHLALLERVDFSTMDPRLKKTRTVLLCDVENPLLGRRGAARAFGPQKGASPRDVAFLEKALRRWAAVLRRDAGVEVLGKPRLGAAGGAAAGLSAGLRGRAVSGIDAVMDAVGFEAHLRWADVILTGEGAVDGTSLEGKALGEVLRRAKGRGKPVLVIAGKWGKGAEAILRKVQGAALVAPGLRADESISRAAALLPGAAGALLGKWVSTRSRR